MKKLLAVIMFMSSVTIACASESKLKMDVSADKAATEPTREVARATDSGVVDVERPESLKYDSPAYKKHKEYLKFIDRHDRK